MTVVYSKSGVAYPTRAKALDLVYDEIKKGNPVILYTDVGSHLFLQNPQNPEDFILLIAVRGDIIFIPDGNGWAQAYPMRGKAAQENPEVLSVYNKLFKDSREAAEAAAWAAAAQKKKPACKITFDDFA